MHLSIFISVFNQLDAQNLFHNKFYFMPLHVSSTCAHHQEVKIALHTLWYHHTYRCDDTSTCARNMYRHEIKLIVKQILCINLVKSWDKLSYICCKNYLRLVDGKLLTPKRQNSQPHNKAVLYKTLRDSVTFCTFENIREETTAEKGSGNDDQFAREWSGSLFASWKTIFKVCISSKRILS